MPEPVETTELSDGDALQGERPPRSLAAWGGFALALVLVLPWVPIVLWKSGGPTGITLGILVGLAGCVAAFGLGIAGIMRTGRWPVGSAEAERFVGMRRRRGRGVAIAALVLSVLAGFTQLLAGATIILVLSMQHGAEATNILKASSDTVKTEAARWREEMASARFQAGCSEEELAGWLREVITERGQMQKAVAMRGKSESSGSATVFRFKGSFVDGAATILVVVGLDNGIPKVDDIKVAGSSPLQWKPGGS